MKKSSSIDNPFFRLMGAIGDLVVLNILWLLCCLPVVTAGASTLALFAIVHKIAAGEDYRTASGFFKAFRRDFKQATALWLVVLAAGIACWPRPPSCCWQGCAAAGAGGWPCWPASPTGTGCWPCWTAPG